MVEALEKPDAAARREGEHSGCGVGAASRGQKKNDESSEKTRKELLLDTDGAAELNEQSRALDKRIEELVNMIRELGRAATSPALIANGNLSLRW